MEDQVRIADNQYNDILIQPNNIFNNINNNDFDEVELLTVIQNSIAEFELANKINKKIEEMKYNYQQKESCRMSLFNNELNNESFNENKKNNRMNCSLDFDRIITYSSLNKEIISEIKKLLNDFRELKSDKIILSNDYYNQLYNFIDEVKLKTNDKNKLNDFVDKYVDTILVDEEDENEDEK